MTAAVVFVGPTLSVAEVRREIDADVRRPAARGDVLRAVMDKPAAIAIIDGFFTHAPAVWHKEILWAMSEGIHVFGAASMGALRAAELAHFGMEGVGWVFDQYRDGSLTDDDEVAVVHAAAEHGFEALSEPMVNIRCTLDAAEQAVVVSSATKQVLLAAAKRLPYYERSYAALLSNARSLPLPEGEVAALRSWIATGRVDRKREDALALLRMMSERQRRGWTKKKVEYRFAPTDAWNALYRQTMASTSDPGHRNVTPKGQSVIDELVVKGTAEQAHEGAFLRALCADNARRAGIAVNSMALAGVVEDFRRERGLLSPADFETWLNDRELGDEAADSYFRREALVRRVKIAFSSAASVCLEDHLRASREYPAIALRAEMKERDLSARGLGSPELGDANLSETELWSWFFVENLGREVPCDVTAFARLQGTTLEDLRTAALREYCYRRIVASGSPNPSSRTPDS